MAQYCDNFRFYDDDNDSFAFWAGLRGPKGDPGAPGAPGSSVELRGPVTTVGDLPASAPADELWMVGSESPYTGYFWNGSSWIDLGAILQGPQGEPGEDGVSPEIEIEAITGGHTVTITDAEHPSGQSFNVMDGQTGPAGQGVPSGGTTGQVLKKKSNTDYDTEWATGGGGGVDPYTDPPEDLGNAASAGSVSKYSRGDHVHKKPSPGDIGAIAAPSSAAAGDYLAFNGSAWISAAVHGVPSGGGAGYYLQKTSSTDYAMQWVPLSNSTPQMDSDLGNAGNSDFASRQDHVHPHDTTKQDVLTFDAKPTSGSTNPVTSTGIYNNTPISKVVYIDLATNYTTLHLPNACRAFGIVLDSTAERNGLYAFNTTAGGVGASIKLTTSGPNITNGQNKAVFDIAFGGLALLIIFIPGQGTNPDDVYSTATT